MGEVSSEVKLFIKFNYGHEVGGDGGVCVWGGSLSVIASYKKSKFFRYFNSFFVCD